MEVIGTRWQATMSPELYVGCIDVPLMGMRKSAPLNAGTTYLSHSYSSAVRSSVSAPAIALNGMRGMPSVLFWAGVAVGMAVLFSFIMLPLPVRSHSDDIS